MKKKLAVIDFDKTLIPYDSFKEYVFLCAKYHPFKILFYIILRKLRVVSGSWFKEKFVLLTCKDTRYHQLDGAFAEKLVTKINHSILEESIMHIGQNGILLILSASPDSYISIVGKLLNLKAKGSFIDENGEFNHLYGKGKIQYLHENYSKEDYDYFYAISDGLSDFSLLKQFKYYKSLSS